MNLYSVMGPSIPERRGILHQIFPLEFIHASRHAALLVGFALIVTSVNLLKAF